MKTIKQFIWFTTHSWSFLQGERLSFFTGFIPAWRKFHELSKND